MTQDLTKITTPFGLLDAETQEALEAHGGPYEWLNWSGSWEETCTPQWGPCYTYRVKPQPPKPREWWIMLDEKTGQRWVCDNPTSLPGVNQKLVRVREVLE